MADVWIRDVGPRDGLQAEAPVAVEDRIALVDALAGTGLPEIEACSFVSPKAVPSMAGAADVMAGITRRPGVRYTALVPNVKGAELALAAGVDALTVTASVSATYNRKNVGMEPSESLAQIEAIVAVAGAVPVDAVLSCCFGCSEEGEIPPAAVGEMAASARSAGVAAVTLADTTGMATPRRVGDVVAVTGTDVGLHLHETRRTALVNAWAAYQLGVRRFDTSIGGLGGSPFAKGAAGNLATEDLVHLLDDCDVESGVDLARLLAVAAQLGTMVGHPLPSAISSAGPRRPLD